MDTGLGDTATAERELIELMAPLRRFVASLLRDRHDTDDVVQETLARVLVARQRLDDEAVPGYAFAIARNLVHDHQRSRTRTLRLLPRLHEDAPPVQPDAAAVASEERRALRSALDALPDEQRALMLAHDLHGEPLSSAGGNGEPAALAAKLSRARARARVDYVLALRSVDLPTARCRPVLRALSAGDRRRQGALRAGRHLVNCPPCASVAPVLVQRDRALAGLIPWLLGGGALGWAVAAVRRHPVQAGAATATIAATAVLVSVWASPAPGPGQGQLTSERSAPAQSRLEVGSQPLLPLRGRLDQVAGQQVRARGVQVLSVPSDEGFWVGRGDWRVWVQLDSRGESSVRIRAGERVTFNGRVVEHRAAFAGRVGITPREGAAELSRQRLHVAVPAGALEITGRPTG